MLDPKYFQDVIVKDMMLLLYMVIGVAIFYCGFVCGKQKSCEDSDCEWNNDISFYEADRSPKDINYNWNDRSASERHEFEKQDFQGDVEDEIFYPAYGKYINKFYE